MITTLLMTAALLAPTAHALPEGTEALVTELVCRDPNRIADAGYQITIRTSGIGGVTEATLAAQTKAGPRELGRYFVKRGRQAATLEYRSEGNDDFALSLIHVRPVPGQVARYIPADFAAEVEGARHTGSLECNSVPRAPSFGNAPGRVTCMAYWSGWEMDSTTGSCVKRGRSGCSNPFEFETESECKAAYFTEIQPAPIAG
jgi:hypothetical protein